MFYGRIYELNILKEAIASARAELGVVYGRRRVGKSALLRKAAPIQSRHSSNLYFEGLQGMPRATQIDHFLTQLSEQTGTPKSQAHNWSEAFDVLSFYIKSNRHYVVFDEFPWMACGRNELVALMKFYWDNEWKHNPGLTFVLCGSIANFMFRHIVHSKALHNRKTFEIKLQPLPAVEAKLFFKNRRAHFELARFLMVFGGIPKYLEQIDPQRSLTANIDRLCFQKNGFFINEFETIFKEQFKVTKTYEKIIRLLAQTSCSREILAQKLNMTAGGGLSTYLNRLEQADFIKVFSPKTLLGRGDKTQKFVLWDEWLRFYFTYMEPNQEIIKLNTKTGMFGQIAGKRFDNYCGLAFERLCMKNLPRILERLEIALHEVLGFGPFFRQPRRSAHRGEEEGLQIDIMVHRKDQVLMLIECKFSTKPIGATLIREVEKKIELLKAPKHYTIEKVLLCSGTIRSDLKKSGYFDRILGLGAIF